jgi:tetratricopeptide (TPR) repeat protein
MLRRAMALLSLIAITVPLSAQFRIPDIGRKGREIIRQGPQRGPAASPSSPSPKKCKALVEWMAILPREAPGIDFYHTALGPKVYDKALNLFRDAYFQPFYGKSFSQTTPEERLDYHKSVFRTCGAGGQLSAEELKTFRELNLIVGGPFLQPHGGFSADTVTTGLAERQTLIAWTQEVTQKLAGTPVTPEAFDELDRYSKRGQSDLEKLWPREREAFLKSISERQSFLARAIVEESVQTAGAHTQKGLEGLRAITSLRSSNQRYLAKLDAERRAQVDRKLEEAAVAAVHSLAAQEKPKLASFPSGIDGVLAVNGWRRGFMADLGTYASAPEVRPLLEEAAQFRLKALTEGLPQFKPVVAQHPKPSFKGMNAVQLINALAPRGAGGNPSADVKPYLEMLYSRLEPSAFGINDAPPFKPAADKNECDDLAAHPQDAARKAEGVADGAIQAEKAAKACIVATQRFPSVARYHFQLGRAYWAAKDYEMAISAFLRAEELQYAPAYFYMAEAYKAGLMPGEPADADFARQLHQIAGAAGFRPAAEAFLGAEGKPEDSAPAHTFFKRPDWILALLVGDQETLATSRLPVLSYVLGMQDFLNVDPHDLDPVCPKRIDPDLNNPIESEIVRLAPVSQLEQFAKLFGATPDATEKMDKQLYQTGVDDISVVLSDYGGCSGTAFTGAYATIKTFVRWRP